MNSRDKGHEPEMVRDLCILVESSLVECRTSDSGIWSGKSLLLADPASELCANITA